MKPLTRKVGPLPVWAYAVIIGGAFLAMRMLRGGTSKQDASVQLIPTGAPSIDPSAGFLNELSMRLDRIETVTTNPPNASGEGTPDPLAAIRDAINKQIIDRITAAITPGAAPTPTTGGGSIQPVATPSAPKPISAKPPAGATYNAATGAWTVHNWNNVDAGTIADMLWANVAGRGPSTAAERDPIVARVQSMLSGGMGTRGYGTSALSAYNQVAPSLAQYRT